MQSIRDGLAEAAALAGGVGIWEWSWQAFLASLDEEGKLEWARAFLEGSFVLRT